MKKLTSTILILLLVGISSNKLKAQNDSIPTFFREWLTSGQRAQKMKELSLPLLVSYEYISNITTTTEKEQLIDTLSSPENYYPMNNGTMEHPQYVIRKRTSIQQNDSIAHSLISNYLTRKIVLPVKKIKLTWKDHAKTYETLCLVSNKEFIYDSIIDNVLLIEDKKILDTMTVTAEDGSEITTLMNK